MYSPHKAAQIRNVGRQRIVRPNAAPAIAARRYVARRLHWVSASKPSTHRNVANVSVITSPAWCSRIGSTATSPAASQLHRPSPHCCPSIRTPTTVSDPKTT